jgi:hypothetical protein
VSKAAAAAPAESKSQRVIAGHCIGKSSQSAQTNRLPKSLKGAKVCCAANLVRALNFPSFIAVLWQEITGV